jgi:hypothetical protein
MTVTTVQGKTGIPVASLYLGAAAADPTTQTDGSALVSGNYYFNTGDELTYTYNGATWAASDISTANLAAPTGSALVGLEGGTVYDVLKEGRLRLTSLVQAPAPILAVNAAAGNLNGTYYYGVTYVTSDGETECSANSAAVSPANQKVDVTLPISASARVTARRIYRTAAGAADSVLKQLVATVNDNTTASYTDNIADGSLGASAPRINTTGGILLENGVRFGAAGGVTTAFGYNAHPANTGYANSAFGAQALAAITSGYRNTAAGIFSLAAITTGARNTGVGVHSVGAATSATDLTGIGYGALQSATGSESTAVGSLALSDCTTGSGNVAVGFDALQQGTTVSNSTAIGKRALQVNNGTMNTAIGMHAYVASTAGNFNTGIGMEAGQGSTTGSGNTIIGFQAGYTNTTGDANVFIGRQAGYYETGSYKLFIDAFTRSNEADARSKALIYGVFDAGGSSGQSLAINGALTAATGFGCNGAAAQPAVAVNAAAADPATTMALVNQLRAALIANGICV